MKKVTDICNRLGIDDCRFVEIESKKRILPEDVKALKRYLKNLKSIRYIKSTLFFDQYLDTPKMEILHKGASLRLRYKKGGANVYLQYKGPGFSRKGLLYRSEFSTKKLKHLLKEESHHDIIRFAKTSIKEILEKYVSENMAKAMREHLGQTILNKISLGPIICAYQKDKFAVTYGKVLLEPSLDRVFAFRIRDSGIHPLSTFCEFENEIKTKDLYLAGKLEYLPKLMEFNEKLARKFSLKREPLDKYHRCASLFVNNAG